MATAYVALGATLAAPTSGQMVWCVVCCDVDDANNDMVHVFSSEQRAKDFCVTDDRPHVIYDYVIDAPERLEMVRQ